MSELDDFLTKTLARQVEAEEAIHNGDPTPRMQMWSTQDPVTLFGAAGPNKNGWGEVSRTFRWVASRFSNCTAYRFDLVAAGVSGDLAYTVGYEHTSVSIDGVPAGAVHPARHSRLSPRERRVEDRPSSWRPPSDRSEPSRRGIDDVGAPSRTLLDLPEDRPLVPQRVADLAPRSLDKLRVVTLRLGIPLLGKGFLSQWSLMPSFPSFSSGELIDVLEQRGYAEIGFMGADCRQLFICFTLPVVCGLGKIRIFARFLMADDICIHGIRENIGCFLYIEQNSQINKLPIGRFKSPKGGKKRSISYSTEKARNGLE